MAKSRRKKSRKSSKRRRGLRGLRGNVGKKAGLFLANVLAANLANEGIAILNHQKFMQQAPPKEGEKASRFNLKKIGASGGLVLVGGGLVVMSDNDWINALATGVATGASIHLKDDAVMPMFGLGAVDDFLNLYTTDEPLEDLSGEERNIFLAAPEQILKLA